MSLPKQIYFNATVVNNTIETTQSADDPPIFSQTTRQTPLLQNIGKYEMQVENFQLNGATKNLPLLIPLINPATTTATVTGLQSTTTTLVYTATNTLQVGDIVTVTGLMGQTAVGNVTSEPVQAATSTTFTLAISSPNTFTNTALSGTATVPNTTDVTTTIYTVTFAAYNGSKYITSTQPIIWAPENITNFTVIPQTAVPIQISTDYYYCYTYTHWVDLMNRALNTAWLDVTTCAAASAGGSAALGTQAPFFEYDCTTGLFSLNVDANTSIIPVGSTLPAPFSVSPATAGYQSGEYSFVGMNANLEGLITNFDNIYYAAGDETWHGNTASNGVNATGYNASSANHTSAIQYLPELVFNFGLTNLNTSSAVGSNPLGVSLKTIPAVSTFQLVNPFTNAAITTANYARLTQDFISTGTLWSPVSSIVLATSQIPVIQEAITNPLTLGSANLGSNGASGNVQKVLIEVPCNSVTSDLWRGFFLYEPLVPTLSSLSLSDDVLTNLDISVYWRNRLTNALTPLKLYNTGTMSIRLKFILKD